MIDTEAPSLRSALSMIDTLNRRIRGLETEVISLLKRVGDLETKDPGASRLVQARQAPSQASG